MDDVVWCGPWSRWMASLPGCSPPCSPVKGAAGPASSTGLAPKLAHSFDATQMAQPTGATSSLDEVTMADAVPLALRMSMREEVLEQIVDEDAKEAATLIKEQKKNLAAKRSQGFQVFYPEAAKALDLQRKAIQHTHLIHQEAEMDEETKRQKTEMGEGTVALNRLDEIWGCQEARDADLGHEVPQAGEQRMHAGCWRKTRDGPPRLGAQDQAQPGPTAGPGAPYPCGHPHRGPHGPSPLHPAGSAGHV